MTSTQIVFIRGRYTDLLTKSESKESTCLRLAISQSKWYRLVSNGVITLVGTGTGTVSHYT